MNVAQPVNAAAPDQTLPLDDTRGVGGMLLFILTEASLFVMLFFSYFYLSRGQPEWPVGAAPKLHWVVPMLVILLASSVVLYWGEHALKKTGSEDRARLAVWATVGLGALFLLLQFFEYRESLMTHRPTESAYASIFYTITSFHALHLVLGLLILGYVLWLPKIHELDRSPHRPLESASLYWHFVDLVWVFIVALLYVRPNLTRP